MKSYSCTICSMIFCLSNKTTVWIEFCVKIKGFNHRRRNRTPICQGFNLVIVKREEILNLRTATSENWTKPRHSTNSNDNSSWTIILAVAFQQAFWSNPTENNWPQNTRTRLWFILKELRGNSYISSLFLDHL